MKAEQLIYDWNTVEQTAPLFPKPIELCDETLRDGLQSPSVKDPPIEAKRRILDLMSELGVTIANIGLPGASKHVRDDVASLAKYVKDRQLPLLINCAARTVVKDIVPIAEIQQQVGIPIAAYCFVGVSPIRQFTEDWDLDKLMAVSEEAISFAVKENLEVAYVTEDTTRSKPETLEPLFVQAIELGCRRLVLCDTVGHATPEGIRSLVSWTQRLIRQTGKPVKLDWHGHNDRGLGLYNALYAAQCGVERIHGTCLGIGERVGNASIDQIMVNLKLLGHYDQNLNRLAEYVELVSKACGVGIPHDMPIWGRDAFRTATGVHAAAVIKATKKGEHHIANTVYSSVPASWFGREQVIEIGPMSGLSNVRHWLSLRQLNAQDEVVQAIFSHAKQVDRVLEDSEILKIVANTKSL